MYNDIETISRHELVQLVEKRRQLKLGLMDIKSPATAISTCHLILHQMLHLPFHLMIDFSFFSSYVLSCLNKEFQRHPER